MHKVRDYVCCAAQLIEMARRAKKRSDKERLMRLADGWLSLAEQARLREGDEVPAHGRSAA